jgi:flagellar hook-length control protein FliK
VQAAPATASPPVVATLTPAASPPAPGVAAAAAPVSAAQVQSAQVTVSQPLATPASPAPIVAETAGRSAKTRAAVGPASGKDARNSADATAVKAVAADPHVALAARTDDDAPLPATDDRPKTAEPDMERPALSPASPGVAQLGAVHSAPVETPRATPQTVALLAAQIASKVDGKSTRFDVQLDPHGLGKVDVRVEISARGDISAALTFENPQSASELRGKAGELQTALEQAGFDLSKTSLSFNSGGQGQQHQGLFDQQQQQSQTPMWRGRAFTDLSDTPEAAPAPVQRRAAAGGVDVRI